MNAVISKKTALLVRIAVASVASFFALQSPACSGSVVTTHQARSLDGGPGDPGAPASGGGFGIQPLPPGTTGSGPGLLCGNGVVDPGEPCDGSDLHGETCYSATMGASPYGTLYCSACTFNLSSCYGGGVGVGGRAGGGGMMGFPGGAAGITGSAGTAGTMGVDPVAVCYAGGGVPDPTNPQNCTTGTEATNICTAHYTSARLSTSQPTGVGSCASGCGCSACAPQYDKCATSSDCMTILDCAEQWACARMVDCYQPQTCQSVIDAVGGQRGRAAIDMSNVLSCMSNAGCNVSCTGAPATSAN